MIGMCQTHVTKRGITSRNFNIPTSFCALLTGLELRYTRVFVFGREMVLYACPNHANSSSESALVIIIIIKATVHPVISLFSV